MNLLNPLLSPATAANSFIFTQCKQGEGLGVEMLFRPARTFPVNLPKEATFLAVSEVVVEKLESLLGNLSIKVGGIGGPT